MKKKYLIFLLPIFIHSCKKENDVTLFPNEEILLGTWVYKPNLDTIMTFSKESRLKDNVYGFTFLNSGKIIERKITGWCATPPVSYSDFNGIWFTKDSVININVDYWGGKANYKWKIVSVTTDSLKIYVQEQKYNNTLGKK